MHYANMNLSFLFLPDIRSIYTCITMDDSLDLKTQPDQSISIIPNVVKQIRANTSKYKDPPSHILRTILSPFCADQEPTNQMEPIASEEPSEARVKPKLNHPDLEPHAHARERMGTRVSQRPHPISFFLLFFFFCFFFRIKERTECI